MPRRVPVLETRILSALRQAVAGNQLEAAEHLLRALEALQTDCLPGTPLADAYLTISEHRERWRT